MLKNRTRAARVALTMLVTLLIAACGLKDDLYIPAGETETSSAEVQNTETGAPDAGSADEEDATDEPESARPPER